MPVSSTANSVEVIGARMVPPIIAAMPSTAQKPGAACGMTGAMTAPSAPPMISSGASTPPDVPEPSATDQITPLTRTRRIAAPPASVPASRRAMSG